LITAVRWPMIRLRRAVHSRKSRVGGVGLPDFGEITEPEQVRQYGRVDLVGLDLGLGDGFGGHGIRHGHSRHEWFERPHDSPAVGGGFHDHLVFRLQPVPADVIEGRGGHTLVAERVHLLSGSVDDVPDDQVFVEINADIAYHGVYSL
jgi:hypothetical protein